MDVVGCSTVSGQGFVSTPQKLSHLMVRLEVMATVEKVHLTPGFTEKLMRSWDEVGHI